MKGFRILGHNIRDAFRSVFRNFSLTLAAISSIAITLLVVAISMVISYNVNNFAELVKDDVTIVAFLKTDITNDDILRVQHEILKGEYIESLAFESKYDITEDMMNASPTFNNIMRNWDAEENPLQDTYLVKVTDINEIGNVAARIKEIDGVDVVKYGEGMVEQLVDGFDIVKTVSLWLVGSLILVTAFLISNTIKIAIFARKREIEIMRLVGASNLNIKVPFIIEGLLLGILGSIIPIGFTVYGYTALYENFSGQILSPFIKLVKPLPFIYYVSLILLLISIVVGMVGSVRAVKRHLKI